jgi:AraC-like DNA-binding protein
MSAAAVPTLIGPRFEHLGAANIVLAARARRHAAEVAAGPFSIKGVTEGEVVWEAGGARFRVEPGSFLVLDRGEPYRLDIDEHRPVETFVVFFADAFVGDLAQARFQSVDDLLEVHARVLRGKALLDARYDEDFDLAAAASEACLSPHHFHRSFAAVVGASPYAYVAGRRMEKAERLLAETDLDAADVCAAVGYASLPSFTRAFRRRTGLPPAAWRARFRNGG